MSSYKTEQVELLPNIMDVYNKIAADFDRTRFSVWKGVRTFLDEIPAGTTACEVGCGNGKNMLYRDDIKFVGYDISPEFVKICKQKGLVAHEADAVAVPASNNRFDYTISVAVIHHLKTRKERLQAIAELIRITKKGGKILIYVWAFEQPQDSKRTFTVGDNLVPFIGRDGSVNNRFYHIYFKGELESEIKSVKKYDFIIEQVFYELGNWCAIIRKI
jgi:tRNA (uracil-5-)-methyltransferase TRM9